MAARHALMRLGAFWSRIKTRRFHPHAQALGMALANAAACAKSDESIEEILKEGTYARYLAYKQKPITRGLLVVGVFATLAVNLLSYRTAHLAVDASLVWFAVTLALAIWGWRTRQPDRLRVIKLLYLASVIANLLSDVWRQPYWLGTASPALLMIPVASAFVWESMVDFACAMAIVGAGMAFVLWRGEGPPELRAYMGAYMGLSLGIASVLHVITVSQRRRNFELEVRLSRNAYTDELTGLANRRYALKHARRMCERCNVEGTPLSVLYIDADYFKQINDRHGHDTGDEVLRHVAKVIESCVRPGDIVGRIGGEEFIAVLHGAAKEKACIIAERIRHAIEKTQVRGLSITVSIGVAEHVLGKDLRSTLHRADALVLKAKRQGRNRVVHAREAKRASSSLV